eukprot:gene49887-1784_t
MSAPPRAAAPHRVVIPAPTPSSARPHSTRQQRAPPGGGGGGGDGSVARQVAAAPPPDAYDVVIDTRGGAIGLQLTDTESRRPGPLRVRGTIVEPAASASPPILLGDVLVGCGGRSLVGLSRADAAAANPKRLRFYRDPNGDAAAALAP